jgi:hypothetical protein
MVMEEESVNRFDQKFIREHEIAHELPRRISLFSILLHIAARMKLLSKL